MLTKKIAILSIIISITGCGQKTIIKIAQPKPEKSEYIIPVQEIGVKSDTELLQTSHVTQFDKSIGKTWRVVVMAPLTGKFRQIGESILDSMILAISEKKTNNVIILPIDTGDNENGSSKAAEAANLAIKLMADVVIGPIFSETAKQVVPILKQANIKIITLSSNSNIAEEGVYVFGVSPEALVATIFGYGKDVGMQNYGIILPSSKSGYIVGQKIDIIMKSMELTKMAVEYYPKNANMFAAIAKRIMFAYRQTYKVNKDGILQTINRKDKFNINNKQNLEDFNNLETISRSMDAIFIDARNDNLYRITKELMISGFANKDITLLSSDPFIGEEMPQNPYITGSMLVASVAGSTILESEKRFKRYFAYKPTHIAMLAYDATNLILHLFKKGGLKDNLLYHTDGFSGVCGDFRITQSGLVQRRFGVYRIMQGRAEMIYKSAVFM